MIDCDANYNRPTEKKEEEKKMHVVQMQHVGLREREYYLLKLQEMKS